MPAHKRPRNEPLQDSPVSKRHAPESPDKSSSDGKTEIIKLLKDCAEKQRDHIARMENVLGSHEPMFERLRDHVQYHLGVQQERFRVQFLTKDQIKEYEKKISGYNRQAMIEKMDLEEMEKQEETLERIVQDVVKYKGYRLQEAEKRDPPLPEPTLYGPYEQELKDALLNIPSVFRDDARMKFVPKLQKTDLDKIEWPQVNHDWSQYSVHWNSEFEEAAECRNLNERIDDLKEKLADKRSVYEKARTKRDRIQLYDMNRNCRIHGMKIRYAERTKHTDQLEGLIKTSFKKKASLEKLKAKERVSESSKKQREDLLRSIQEEVNAESLKCSVCFEALTNGEQSERCPQLFASCGHTVCATCMTRFKGRDSPYHWTCHQCRKPSDKVLTNWSLMQLIKEIPGQPQRVVVDTPAAVPIVPAPWRLEQREPNIQERGRNLIPDIDDILERHRRLLENLLAPVVPIAPAPVAPIAPAPVAPIAPAPVAPIAPAPVAPIAPAPVAPIAPAPVVPIAPAPVAPIAPAPVAPIAPAPALPRVREDFMQEINRFLGRPPGQEVNIMQEIDRIVGGVPGQEANIMQRVINRMRERNLVDRDFQGVLEGHRRFLEDMNERRQANRDGAAVARAQDVPPPGAVAPMVANPAAPPPAPAVLNFDHAPPPALGQPVQDAHFFRDPMAPPPPPPAPQNPQPEDPY